MRDIQSAMAAILCVALLASTPDIASAGQKKAAGAATAGAGPASPRPIPNSGIEGNRVTAEQGLPLFLSFL
ncbi:MAG: hypothetical protein L0H83_12515 [Salinisphaera sp.]|nr:hypothetical protein [Salinisphaera sp.]